MSFGNKQKVAEEKKLKADLIRLISQITNEGDHNYTSHLQSISQARQDALNDPLFKDFPLFLQIVLNQIPDSTQIGELEDPIFQRPHPANIHILLAVDQFVQMMLAKSGKKMGIVRQGVAMFHLPNQKEARLKLYASIIEDLTSSISPPKDSEEEANSQSQKKPE